MILTTYLFHLEKSGTEMDVIWDVLFPEIIVLFLDVRDVVSFGLTCRRLQSVAERPYVWKQLTRHLFSLSESDLRILEGLMWDATKHNYDVNGKVTRVDKHEDFCWSNGATPTPPRQRRFSPLSEVSEELRAFETADPIRHQWESHVDDWEDREATYLSGPLVVGPSAHDRLTALWDDVVGTRHSTPQPLLESEVKMSVVCAATLRESFREGCLTYPFKNLFRMIYVNRAGNFLSLLSSRRNRSIVSMTYGDHESAVSILSENVRNIVEGGCGRLNEVRHALVKDLILRGRCLLMLHQDESALDDFALATLLDPQQAEAYSECTLITTTPARCSSQASKILSPAFDMEDEYDRLVTSGQSLGRRASFLFEVMFWRGPSLMLYMYQYFLCDALKVWPVRLLFAAENFVDAPYQKLMLRSWMCYDRGENDKALEAAELAVSLLPASVARALQATEKKATSLARRVVCGEQVDEVPQVLAQTIRDVGDVNLASLLIASDQFFNQPMEIGKSVEGPASFALFTLGFVGRWSEISVDSYRKYVFAKPPPSRVSITLNNIASSLMHRREMTTALALVQQAVAISPHNFMCYRSLARSLAALGRGSEAQSVYSLAIQQCEHTAEAHLERSKFVVDPSADLSEATKWDPRMSHPYRLRAAMLMDRGNFSDAVSELDKVTKLTFAASDIALRALFRYDSGDLDGSIADMSLAVTLAPSREEFHSSLKQFISERIHRRNQHSHQGRAMLDRSLTDEIGRFFATPVTQETTFFLQTFQDAEESVMSRNVELLEVATTPFEQQISGLEDSRIYNNVREEWTTEEDSERDVRNEVFISLWSAVNSVPQTTVIW